MALQWDLKLVDGLSGPAGQASSAASKLDGALGEMGDSASKADDALKKTGASAEALGAKASKAGDDVGKLGAAIGKLDKNGRMRDAKGRFLDMGKGGSDAASKIADAGVSVDKMTRSLNHGVPKLSAFGKGVQFMGRYFGPRAAGMTMAAGRAVAQYGEHVQRAGRLAAGAAGAMGSVAMVVGAAGAVAVGGAVAGAVHIRQAQAFRESTLFAFEQILKSKEEAAKTFAMASKTSLDLGADFRDSVGSMNTLMAQGFDTKFADDLIRRMADLKTINPAADLTKMVTAIGQIKATGRLQGDELMQLVNAGISVEDVYKHIAKSMGVTAKAGKTVNEQVASLQEQGKIKAGTAIDAIMASVAEKTGGGAAGAVATSRADKSLEGTIARALNLKEQLLGAIKIDWSPLSNAIKRFMDAMQSEKGQKFMDAIGTSIDKVLTRLDGISDSDMETFFEEATTAVKLFSDAIQSTFDLIEALGPAGAVAWDGMKASMQLLAGAIDIITFAVEGLNKAFSAAKSNAEGLKSVLAFAGGGILGGAVNQVANENSSKGTSSGQAFGTGAAIGIGLASGNVVGAASALAGAAESAFAGRLKIRSPSKVGEDLGYNFAEGPAGGIRQGIPLVANASSNLATVAAASAAGMTAGRTIASTTNATDNSRAVTVGSIHVTATDDAASIATAIHSELRGAVMRAA